MQGRTRHLSLHKPATPPGRGSPMGRSLLGPLRELCLWVKAHGKERDQAHRDFDRRQGNGPPLHPSEFNFGYPQGRDSRNLTGPHGVFLKLRVGIWVRCMPGVFLGVWPTDAYEGSVADIWRRSDLVERAIYVSLVLMLVYTLFIVIRFFPRYRLACRLGDLNSEPLFDLHRNGPSLIADLSRGLGTLKGIASAAPFLGLAGTSYGILAAFSYGAHGYIYSLSGQLALRLTAAAVGVLVAIPAIVSHNILSTCIEHAASLISQGDSSQTDLGSSQFAQTRPLKRRFSGMPHFALVAAPFLILVLMMYLASKPYPTPKGLPVRLLPRGQLDAVHTSAEPITVSVLLGSHSEPLIRVNSEEIPSDQLEAIVSQKLQGLGQRHAYVEGDSSVPWGYITGVIDRVEGLHCRVILITSTPAGKGKRRSSHR